MKTILSKVLGVVIGAVLVVAVFVALRDGDAGDSAQQEGGPAADGRSAVSVTEPENAEAESAGSAHPVSIPGLAQKEYDGRDLRVGQVLDDNPAYTRYHITYESGDLTISGIMNVPKGDGPFPVLFLNHGYIDPAVYTNGRGLKREQDYLARNGYVVIHSDYRNHAQSDKDPDADLNFRLGYAEDVVNAVHAVRDSGLQYLDGERIGMLGHSMGGGVTQNIITALPDLVDAAVLFAPVSADNFDNFQRWTQRRAELAERVVNKYGTPDTNPEFWRGVSAVNFLDRIQTPVLLHHGTADADVPVEWSDRLARLLEEAGKDIVYHVYPGQPHEFTSDWSLVMRRTLDFYNQHLK